jgi:hypothetical protein
MFTHLLVTPAGVVYFVTNPRPGRTCIVDDCFAYVGDSEGVACGYTSPVNGGGGFPSESTLVPLPSCQ